MRTRASTVSVLAALASVALASCATSASVERAKVVSEPAEVRTVREIMNAWGAGDAEGVLARLHPEIVFYGHVGSPPMEGLETVRAFLQRHGSGISQVRWRATSWAARDDQVLIEGVEDYVDAEGRRIEVPYMGVFEFEDGRVIGWRDYFDRALITEQKSGEPVRPSLAPLLAKPAVLGDGA